VDEPQVSIAASRALVCDRNAHSADFDDAMTADVFPLPDCGCELRLYPRSFTHIFTKNKLGLCPSRYLNRPMSEHQPVKAPVLECDRRILWYCGGPLLSTLVNDRVTVTVTQDGFSVYNRNEAK
jgi:hypothetical protein